MQEKYKDIFRKFKENFKDITGVGKVLGKGAFGEVRDIEFRGKVFAGKIIEKDDDEISNEGAMLELRGQNIIKIMKVYSKEFNDKYYDLIIMEKAILRDLGKLNEFYHRHNLLKLIVDSFDEKSGDNLLRFYARQIVNAIETLERNNYVHFDLKPENLLITVNLIIKLSDFSLIKKVESDVKLPGGTPGYLTPEYFIEKEVKEGKEGKEGKKEKKVREKVTKEIAKKQDYFALGSILFILKYGIQLLKYRKYEEKIMNADRIIDLLQKNITFLKSRVLTDKDFIKFVLGLIQYNPENRFNFEEIYRNKWLNKNCDELDMVFNAFEKDEEKLIMELQKKDYLVKKEKLIKKEKASNQIKFRFKKKKRKDSF